MTSGEAVMEDRDEQQGTTAPYAAWDLGAALAHAANPVEDTDRKDLASYLRMAADAWAASHAEEPKDRALARVRFLRLVELSADLALHDAVDNARGAGASWAGIGSALGTSRQTAHQRFTD
ncbi:hypothetical protein IEE92_13605 [Kocuria sp. cx-116]|uniref:hypothetical protein n=1 Tax=Kocuria sp. cx-116 TaxID=2771378 RepID=UPI001685D4CC|nr:hypothetical protein [Kocuria sp. cx-116]MBD2763563.1 hypothetical protein [Kocuria sp. cx-116]